MRALIIFALCLCACQSTKPKLAATVSNTSPTVAIVDSVNSGANIIGTASNPMNVTSSGAVDGGATVASNPAVSVLATTGISPGIGLSNASQCHVTSLKVENYTATNGWAFLSNRTLYPDAGFTAIADTVTLVPAGQQVVLGTDHFGQAGLFLDAGCSIGISATSPYDAGGTTGVWTAPATQGFGISVYGYSP